MLMSVFFCLVAEENDELTDQDLMKMYSELDESTEQLMPCSNNDTSLTAVSQNSPSKKRSRMSGHEVAVDEVNRNSDLLTKSNREMTTGNVLLEMLNVAADPTKCGSGDVERRGKQAHMSPGKENSPEPQEKSVLCHSQEQPKRKNAFAVDGKAIKEPKFSLNSSKLDGLVENHSDVEGKDVSSQPKTQGKRRNIFAVDGKAPNETKFSLNSSKLDTTVERTPEAEMEKATSPLQVKSKRKNLSAPDEDVSKERSFSLTASKHDAAVESRGKDGSSPSQVQLKQRRNVFAVEGKAPKESRFSLNSSKLDTPAVNVKSR